MELQMVLVIAGLAVAMASLVWIWRWSRRRREADWRRFARRHGLRVIRRDGRPIVAGDWDGRLVQISIAQDGSDGELVGIVPVRMEAALRVTAPHPMTVTCSGTAIGTLAQGLGANTLSVDDARSGHLILQEGTDAAAAAAFLTPSRRQALWQLAQEVDPATAGLEDQAVYCEDRMAGIDIDRLEAWRQALGQAASALERSE